MVIWGGWVINVNYYSRSTTIKIPVLGWWNGGGCELAMQPFSRPRVFLEVLSLQFLCPVAAEPDIAPRDVVNVHRVVVSRLDEQPSFAVSDHSDTVTAAAVELGRVVVGKLNVEGYQTALLGVIHRAFHSASSHFWSC